MAERDNLMKKIQMYSFLITEVTLYLDTHKNCPRGLEYFRKYRDMYNAAVDEYTERFGPIQAIQAKAEGSWDWTDAPWPWEKED